MSQRLASPVGRVRLKHRAVTIALIAVAELTANGCRNTSRLENASVSSSPLEALAAAVGPNRLIRGRVTGAFQYGPESVPRGAVRVASAVSIAAARAEESLEAERNSRTLNASAVAHLLTGRTDIAVEELLEATVAEPTDASLWSNLSAAYLEQAGQRAATTIEPLIRAVDAGERAVALGPSLSEAWFNVALARELLGRRDALAAWQRYAALETTAGWREDAAGRVNPGQPDASTDWATLRAVLEDGASPDSEVTTVCRTFPGETRTHVEEMVLARWAVAVDGRDAAGAARLRHRLKLLAACLRSQTADRLIEDIAAGIPTGLDGRRQASAFSQYRKGRQLLEQGHETDAALEFEGADRALADRSSPFASLIAFQQATLDYQHRRLRSARGALEALVRDARRRGYPSLEVRGHIMLGSVMMQEGLLHEAADEYTRAATLVAPLDDPELAATALYSLANTARLVGNSHVGWSALARALAQLNRIANARRRYMVLYNASMLAEHDGLPHAAKYFQDGALDVAIERGVAGSIAEAYTRRAALEQELGRHDAAAEDLASAASSLRSVTDPLRAEYYRALLDATRGVHATTTDPGAAHIALSRAIAFFRTVEPADVPKLLLERGRASVRLSRPGPAADDFIAGIGVLERLRARTSDRADRISLFDSAWQLFDEMVALHTTEPDIAFEFAERGRARTLADANLSGHPRLLRPAQIAARLDDHSVILQYATLPNETLLWLLRRSGARLFRIPAGANQLSALVTRYVATLRRDTAAADETRLAERLHTLLLGPVRELLVPGDQLVIVGEGPLLSLPFAALLRPQSGRRVIEDFGVITAPSSNLFLWSAAAASLPRSHQDRVLTVGNPTFDRAAYPELRDLPGAGREADHIGGMFAGATVLTGSAATKERFLQELKGTDIVHIASHAVINEDYPLDSEVLFAATAGGMSNLSIEELGRIRVNAPRLVVLAACSTARGPVYRLEGVMSLARAFMEIGAPQVVATLWDVDDTSAERVFDGFYKAMIRGSSPASALRAAQLALVTDGDPRWRSPRHWAPYILFGGEPDFIRR